MKDYTPTVVYSHNSKVTGMAVFILKTLARLLGDGTFAVATLPLPTSQAERDFAVNLAQHPSVQYAYRDDDKLVYVRLGGLKGWLFFARSSGIVVRGMGKVVKRLKAFNRPALLGAKFEFLNVEVVSDDAFSREDLDREVQGIINATREDLRLDLAEYKERLLDGWIVMSTRVYRELLRQSEFHTNVIRRELQIRRAKRAKVFNVRITTDMGFIKGNCAVGRNMPKGVDIFVAGSGIKEEIESSNHFFVIAEPQEMKESVRTNAQTMINLPKLFRQSDMDSWLKDFFAKCRADVVSGHLMPSFTDIESLRWRTLKDLDYVGEGISAAMQYAAIEFAMRGGDLRKSPALLKMVTDAWHQNLVNEGNVRIPVPCAVHAQIISESAATMAGHFIKVERGAQRFCEELECFVINDIDFIMGYDNHGGNDSDDLYDHFFRTMDGKKVVIVARSPNGKGEYSIYDYVDGDYYPVWTKADGTEISFPEVNAKGWPKRVSEALNDGSLVYSGLPSANRPKDSNASSDEYARESFIKDVDESLQGGSVGVYINARMLWDLVFPGMRKTHICSLEDAIDTFVQAGAQEDRLAISAAAQELLDEVVASGRTIDEHFWTSRPFARNVEEGRDVKLGEGMFTRAHKLLDSHIKEFVAWRNAFAAKNVAVPDVRVHVLGGKNAALTPLNQRSAADVKLNDLYQQAVRLIKAYRRAIGFENDRARANYRLAVEHGVFPRPDDRIPADRWVLLFKPIMEALAEAEANGGIVARHNLAMALLSASYSVPTRYGISDTIPWNAKYSDERVPQGPFPYTMEALRFYGIFADIVDIDDDGTLTRKYNDSWELVCSNCGLTHVTANPVVMQRFHLMGGLCKDCRNS